MPFVKRRLFKLRSKRCGWFESTRCCNGKITIVEEYLNLPSGTLFATLEKANIQFSIENSKRSAEYCLQIVQSKMRFGELAPVTSMPQCQVFQRQDYSVLKCQNHVNSRRWRDIVSLHYLQLEISTEGVKSSQLDWVGSLNNQQRHNIERFRRLQELKPDWCLR